MKMDFDSIFGEKVLKQARNKNNNSLFIHLFFSPQKETIIERKKIVQYLFHFISYERNNRVGKNQTKDLFNSSTQAFVGRKNGEILFSFFFLHFPKY